MITRLSRASIVVLGVFAVLIVIAAVRSAYFPLKQQETFSKAFTLTLEDMNGNPVRLLGYENKIVIAYAWASWCPYCAKELQDLSKIKTDYGDKVQIVAINRAEDKATAAAYIASLTNVSGIVFLLDPTDSFFKSVGGYAMPETIFVQRSGQVAFHQHGPITYDQVSQELEKLLGH
ncbi:MAG TPA: TlpA disulfide reductase family protein [Candidatus Paceibacterota bacterium]|nr:TlpA disulfide reductase family protein [Candidatus Paceibacterota bacterium]